MKLSKMNLSKTSIARTRQQMRRMKKVPKDMMSICKMKPWNILFIQELYSLKIVINRSGSSEISRYSTAYF